MLRCVGLSPFLVLVSACVTQPPSPNTGQIVILEPQFFANDRVVRAVDWRAQARFTNGALAVHEVGRERSRLQWNRSVPNPNRDEVPAWAVSVANETLAYQGLDHINRWMAGLEGVQFVFPMDDQGRPGQVEDVSWPKGVAPRSPEQMRHVGQRLERMTWPSWHRHLAGLGLVLGRTVVVDMPLGPRCVTPHQSPVKASITWVGEGPCAPAVDDTQRSLNQAKQQCLELSIQAVVLEKDLEKDLGRLEPLGSLDVGDGSGITLGRLHCHEELRVFLERKTFELLRYEGKRSVMAEVLLAPDSRPLVVMEQEEVESVMFFWQRPARGVDNLR
jgi:hypothetical protein